MLNHTKLERKENIKALFFNYSHKHWYFKDILLQGGLSRAQTNKWLLRLVKEKLIKKLEKKGKRPYYVANANSPKFKSEKKLFALKKFENSGFLAHLSSLPKAKTVILFGSFARADWHWESDIDIFIYGTIDKLEKTKYEKLLGREIQVFNYKNKKEISNLEKSVYPQLLSGIHLKGKAEPFTVSI
jgi:predicted nucleotidyltransferase